MLQPVLRHHRLRGVDGGVDPAAHGVRPREPQPLRVGDLHVVVQAVEPQGVPLPQLDVLRPVDDTVETVAAGVAGDGAFALVEGVMGHEAVLLRRGAGGEEETEGGSGQLWVAWGSSPRRSDLLSGGDSPSLGASAAISHGEAEMQEHRTRPGPDWTCVTRQAPWRPPGLAGGVRPRRPPVDPGRLVLAHHHGPPGRVEVAGRRRLDLHGRGGPLGVRGPAGHPLLQRPHVGHGRPAHARRRQLQPGLVLRRRRRLDPRQRQRRLVPPGLAPPSPSSGTACGSWPAPRTSTRTRPTP